MKIGLLPLYLKLYDDDTLVYRERMGAFYQNIADKIKANGFEVITSDFCRLENEFKNTIKNFEQQNADAIVTIHLAYSPSLECIDALAGTKLPIVVLDATETLEFSFDQNPDEIMYCHGIHGVMDMCNMLTRRGKAYAIAAGHIEESNCVERACGYVRSAVAASALSKARVGLVGGVFKGMGDFQIPYPELKKRFGIDVFEQSGKDMKKYYDLVTDEELESEKKFDAENYDFDDNVIAQEYTESVKSCLAMRKCIENQKLTAFSVNFSTMGANSGITSMPFMEACKAMQRGIGYAGEGDVMTAAFTGAFLSAYPQTNFVEIFCPDWKNNMVFLSHMGEINYGVAATKPHIKRLGTKYSAKEFPYAAYTRMKGGKGVYININRTKDNYKLVLVAAEMLDCEKDNFTSSMRGWMKTECSTAHLLEQLSINSATHHSVFVYGATTEELEFFGKLLNLETVVIK